MRYLVGLIGFPLGIIFIVYRDKVKRFTGSIGFAESYFGQGGTYTFYVLLGLAISVGSLLWMFGTIQSIIGSVLGPLF
ncbi:hypothetical protein COV82_02040 [Candidatus Peregrinibacteria bacterium CG11_big_fil_rev_8_21_14_0_20_46_8]|nr:MAG: hypothetical protein COV82_02040 [Candidatus Peregrinibacteria bacterium CG11_big_fil_rev_8_21_14_0_20_46_8]